MADTAADEAPVAKRAFGGAFMEGLEGLGILRQMGLMIGLAASVAMGFAVIIWIQGEDYKPLYGSLENLDAPEVVRVLEGNAIPYKIDQNSGALMVASADIHTARLKLSEAGVQVGGGRGFELLDQEQPLGTSQFMEQTRFRRGLEGELSRTITSINAVKSARVHLAIPKSTVFLRDPRRPSASVFLELYAGRTLQAEQVMAIGNLVASSVPELEINDVTFGSAANAYGRDVLAVILTGMGADGTEGARLLKGQGATVWSQDEQSSVIYGMPMAVAKARLTDAVLPLDAFAENLKTQVR